jgi:hypothetical protein
MPIATNNVFTTGYVYDEKALEHVNKDQNVEEHPEIPERIEKIHSILKKKRIFKPYGSHTFSYGRGF